MSDSFRFSPSITGDGEFTQITSEGSTFVVAISTDSKLYYRTGKIMCRKEIQITFQNTLLRFFSKFEIHCIS